MSDEAGLDARHRARMQRKKMVVDGPHRDGADRARRAVLTRLYAGAARTPAGLRFGLPPPDGWARLDAALHAATREALAA